MIKTKILETGTYLIDEDYHLLAMNLMTKEWYPDAKVGDLCYKALALLDEPCPICPLSNESALIYNNPRHEWIHSSASTINIAPFGECYCIQFRRHKNRGGTKRELIHIEKIDEYITELVGASTGKECVLAGYCAAGSPLFFANEQFVDLLGYDSLDEMINSIDGMLVNIMHPEDVVKLKNDMKGTLSDDCFEFYCRMRKKDTSWIWIAAKARIIRTATGNPVTLAVCSDISDVLKRQEMLQLQNNEYHQMESLFNDIALNMPSGYHRCSTDDGFKLSFISNSFLDIVGWTREELENELNNQFINIVAPEDRDMFLRLEPQLAKNGRIDAVYRICRKDGSRRWIKDSTVRVEQDNDKFYQCTLADITEYVENINKEKDRAEASNRAKSTFLFNASHDIRTPLNAIHGFIQILKDNLDDKQLIVDTIEKIEKSSDTLSNLLGDVLELSRIESGKEDLNVQAVHLHHHIQDLFEMFDDEMKKSNIIFELKKNIQHANVLCDTLKLSRICMNMLSNAKKFTPAGGNVVFGVDEISSDETTATYRFYTRDTGIGMSSEFQKRAFEQFERERTSTDSGLNGSGLGLAIIKRLTEMMGGNCNIESELGKGTEISATITFTLVDETAAQNNKVDIKSVDMKGKRVLLVEDNEFNREIARYMLESINLIVDEEPDGSAAVNKLLNSDDNYYDLVLMDIQMPVMDGYTATKEIRQINNKLISSIPIIAMTANAFQEDKERCLSAGMNGHIAKPIDMNELIQILYDVLR